MIDGTAETCAGATTKKDGREAKRVAFATDDGLNAFGTMAGVPHFAAAHIVDDNHGAEQECLGEPGLFATNHDCRARRLLGQVLRHRFAMGG